MSNNDPQQNVDAIRKILFGQEQQQLEQKIAALTMQLEQLHSQIKAQASEHTALTGHLHQTKQDLGASMTSQVSQLQQGIQSLSKESHGKSDSIHKALVTMHADMDAKLSTFAQQSNAYSQQLSQALEQSQIRIKQLEDNEQALKQALAQPYAALSQFFKA
jgi:chromosome segregation ATPase